MPLHVDISSTKRFYSNYPVEKFKFSWTITNFSKIFNKIHYEFFTSSNATRWKTTLKKPKRIEMSRCFEGESVNVVLDCSIITPQEVFSNVQEHTFTRIFENISAIDLPYNLASKLENDVMEFRCTMRILGHTIHHESALTYGYPHSSKKMSQDFQNLLQRKDHCDTTIRVNTEEIQVHKAILCARSPVLDRMFHYNVVENENSIIEIGDIEYEILKTFITYLYTAEVKDLCWGVAFQLYYAADKYEVEDLQKICGQFLELHMTAENACDVLKLSDMHKDNELKNSVMKFIRTYTSSVKQTNSWKEMIISHPKLALEVYE